MIPLRNHSFKTAAFGLFCLNKSIWAAFILAWTPSILSAQTAADSPATPVLTRAAMCVESNDGYVMSPELTLHALIAQYNLVGLALKNPDTASLLALVFDGHYCDTHVCADPAEKRRQQHLALVTTTQDLFPVNNEKSLPAKADGISFSPVNGRRPQGISGGQIPQTLYFSQAQSYPLSCDAKPRTFRDVAQACVSNFLRGSGTKPICPQSDTEASTSAHARSRDAASSGTSNQEKATAATAISLQGARLQSNPDQMTQPSVKGGDKPTPYDTLHSSDNNYLATTGAKISFGRSAGSTSVADSIVGTIGYGFGFGSSETFKQTLVIPYVGMDREGKFASPGAKTEAFSANTFDFGTILQTDMVTNAGQVLTFALRPDYLENYLDSSRIFSLNLKGAPTMATMPINHFQGCGNLVAGCETLFRWMIQFDLRANLGWFTNTGKPMDSRLNHDYTRLGMLIGPQVEINLFPDYPIDLGATYTDYLPVRGFHKSLGFFQSGLTFNFDKSKILGLSAQYIHGRRDDTATPIQVWLLGLTLHY